MKTKWIITVKGLENYRLTEDGKVYRLAHHKNRRSFEPREIKKQYPNRYRLNNEWWSEIQLKPHLELDPNPIELYKEGTPFKF